MVVYETFSGYISFFLGLGFGRAPKFCKGAGPSQVWVHHTLAPPNQLNPVRVWSIKIYTEIHIVWGKIYFYLFKTSLKGWTHPFPLYLF